MTDNVYAVCYVSPIDDIDLRISKGKTWKEAFIKAFATEGREKSLCEWMRECPEDLEEAKAYFYEGEVLISAVEVYTTDSMLID